ncbi:PssE/Cps14G family polysaccharide biosynthesis glycosyltransferase [Ruegeria atlantica]|uniref:PssE/Cps14G family polysaccharide biosynthesis glycosyltransferase n=1 Tax=Ruegeria atlantica TaxID=81569 RepID=UPI00148071CA|nr:PssE/Cps14G family polysaccharide biosynthesis glycosyltransferase [Ruegeria atlantica]
MKFVTTVGTTAFDSLIEKVDTLSDKFGEFEFLSQIGPGTYQPHNHPWVTLEKNFLSRHRDAILITHCGAGTVYYLLEERIPFIAVPNLERADTHQIELAQFLHQNSYAPVCFDVEDLSKVFQNRTWETFSFVPYEKDNFFRADEIRQKIYQWLK